MSVEQSLMIAVACVAVAAFLCSSLLASLAGVSNNVSEAGTS